MDDDRKSTQVSASLDAFADLAVECWRLGRCLETIADSNQKVTLNHVHRWLTRFVEEIGLQVMDLSGQPYDVGLALEVIDTLEMENIPNGVCVVGRMTSPMVLHNGCVVRHGIAPVYKGLDQSIRTEDGK